MALAHVNHCLGVKGRRISIDADHETYPFFAIWDPGNKEHVLIFDGRDVTSACRVTWVICGWKVCWRGRTRQKIQKVGPSASGFAATGNRGACTKKFIAAHFISRINFPPYVPSAFSTSQNITLKRLRNTFPLCSISSSNLSSLPR